MGMSVGSGKGPQASINVTPMIDVLLVLLIIFMIIMPHSHGEDVLLPQPSDEKTPQPEIISKNVVLQVTQSSDAHPSIKINEQAVDWADLPSRLKAIFEIRTQKTIFLKADSKLNWEEVAQVIDVAHSAGIKNVGLMTDSMEGR